MNEHIDLLADVVKIIPHRDVYLIRLEAPRIAEMARPFQFVLVKVPESSFILRRPFSIFDAFDKWIDLLIRPAGPGTRRICESKPGDKIPISGPFGRTLDAPQDTLFIAGGVGYAGLNLAITTAIRKGYEPRIYYGAATSMGFYTSTTFDPLFSFGFPAEERLSLFGKKVKVTFFTEDGTKGTLGLVTKFLDIMGATTVIACGHWNMYKAIIKNLKKPVNFYVLLEEHMACGVGACRACAIPARNPPNSYLSACKDGPIFDAKLIDWDRGGGAGWAFR